MIDGVQWVLKFADDYDHDWPLIEHAVMRLGAACGIEMCETRAINIGTGRSAIAIRRFDRRIEGIVELRSHCISAGVALVAAGEELGYPELAGVLRRLSPADETASSRHELFRRMVFNILCDNTDDHERNHSLVLGPDGYSLSPAYDVVPAMQNLGYQALRVGAAQMDSTLDNAMSSAGAFGFSRDTAAAVIADICGTFDGWQRSLAAEGVSDRDSQALEAFLDGEKLAMRTEFLRLSRPSKPSGTMRRR